MQLRLRWGEVLFGLLVGLIGSLAVVHFGLEAKEKSARELRADVLHRVTRLHIAERTPHIAELVSRYADAAVESETSEATYLGTLLDAYRMLSLSHRHQEAEEVLRKAHDVCRRRRNEMECGKLRERFLQCKLESSTQTGSTAEPSQHASDSPDAKPMPP